MITDNTIESGSTYWCLLKDPEIQTILDGLYKEYDDAYITSVDELTNDNVSEAGKGSLGGRKLGKEAIKLCTDVIKNKWFKGAAVTGASSAAVGTGVGYGVEKLGDGLGTGVEEIGKGVGTGAFAAKNSGLTAKELADDPKLAEINRDNKVTLADIGILAGGAAALYALFKFRKPIMSRLSQLTNWFKRGQLFAKSNFNSDGVSYEVVFDLKTCKWSLLHDNTIDGAVNRSFINSYATTNHFKDFSAECYKVTKKYLDTKEFEYIAKSINLTTLDDSVKDFFDIALTKKQQILNGLRNKSFN